MLGLIGKTFSHYRIMEQIGQGGMSSVFRAVDLRDERAVAVKVLSPYIASEPRFRARFEREIKLLHRMQHPNIMPILDFGEVDGLAYIVMPYIGSGTLQDRLARGPLDPKEGSRIVAQLAAALACAHENGVIHRDVKPSNVLLDPMGNALLSDFSFAHQADASQNLTGSALVGTPAYMSPEQCRGEPIDARSDQYALTIVLYQIATGKLPFEGDTPMAVAMKHVNEPVPPPSLVNPNLPPEIELVLVRGLAKDPKLRYASVMELNAAFQSAMEIALHPARRTGTRDLHRTQQLYDKYQNVNPPARRRWLGRSALLAALMVLVACPASAAGIASFFPGLISGGNGRPTPDVMALVNAALTANAPGPGTYVPLDALQTQVYLAVVQTLSATGASLGQHDQDVLAMVAALDETPTPALEGTLIFPTLPPTSTRTLAAGQGPPHASATQAATLTHTSAPTAVPSSVPTVDTPAPTATSGLPVSDTVEPSPMPSLTASSPPTVATTPTPTKTHPGPPPTATTAPPAPTATQPPPTPVPPTPVPPSPEPPTQVPPTPVPPTPEPTKEKKCNPGHPCTPTPG